MYRDNTRNPIIQGSKKNAKVRDTILRLTLTPLIIGKLNKVHVTDDTKQSIPHMGLEKYELRDDFFPRIYQISRPITGTNTKNKSIKKDGEPNFIHLERICVVYASHILSRAD